MITEEILEEILPSKEDKIKKIIEWNERGLLNTDEVLKRCLQNTSDHYIDDLFNLLAPAFEDCEDKEEDDYDYMPDELFNSVLSQAETTTAGKGFIF